MKKQLYSHYYFALKLYYYNKIKKKMLNKKHTTAVTPYAIAIISFLNPKVLTLASTTNFSASSKLSKK